MEININIEGYNVNGICVGCLNYNRKMFYHDDVKDCFKTIANIDVPDGLTIQVCWECMAAVRSYVNFKMQILSAYKVLIDYSKQHTFLNSPKDLTQYAETRLTTSQVHTFDSMDLSPTSMCNESDTEVKTEIKDDQMYFETENIKAESTEDSEISIELPPPELDEPEGQSSDEDIQLSRIKQDKQRERKKKKNKEHKQSSRKLKNLPEDIVELYTMTEEEMWEVRANDVTSDEFQNLRHKCELCIIWFNTQKLKDYHDNGKHRPKSDKSHQCDVCQAYFLTKDNLAVHRSLHLTAYRCRLCEARTSMKRLMLNHACAKNTAVTLTCTDCGTEFSSKSRLAYHRTNVCQQEKPQCDCCGKVFANKMTLKYHLKYGHDKSTARIVGNTSQEKMKEGLLLIRNGTTIRTSAKTAGVPYATLKRYYDKTKNCASLEGKQLEPNYSANKTFTSEQELSLVDHFIKCSHLFYGLSGRESRILAYQYAKMNDVKIPATWVENEAAGKDWLRSFRRRQIDSLKNVCSATRTIAFSKTNVQKFYDSVEHLSSNPAFADGSRIFSLDEISTINEQESHENTEAVTSGKRTWLTTCCIISASGCFLPPVMVFSEYNFEKHNIANTPGSLVLVTPSGWNSNTFPDVIKHFIKNTNSSQQNPSVLIMDTDESHLCIEALELAKNSGVHLLTLHPRTAFKLQPLEVGVYGPFRETYNGLIESWRQRNPVKLATIYDVAELISSSIQTAMSPINITDAFAKCGIYPFHRYDVTDEDFLSSTIANRHSAQLSIQFENVSNSVGLRVETPSVLQSLDLMSNLVEVLQAELNSAANEPIDQSMISAEPSSSQEQPFLAKPMKSSTCASQVIERVIHVKETVPRKKERKRKKSVLDTRTTRNKDVKRSKLYLNPDNKQEIENDEAIDGAEEDRSQTGRDVIIPVKENHIRKRNRKRTTDAIRKIGNHTGDQMMNALEAISSGTSIRHASVEHKIPYPTLRRYHMKRQSISAGDYRFTPNYAVRKVFTEEKERTLCDYYQKYALMFHGLSQVECRVIAYDTAKRSDVNIPVKWERDKMAGKDWFRGFRERFPDLALYKRKDKATVKHFLDRLENVAMDDGAHIFNLDEVTVEPSESKITADNETEYTICNIISADGQHLSPAIVFPIKNSQHTYTETPPGSLILTSPSGNTNTEVFVEIMTHFLQQSTVSKDLPAILIMDDDKSHLSIEALELAEKSGVTVMILPDTEKIQPLDLIHDAFKAYFRSEMKTCVRRSDCDVGQIIGRAFEKTMTPANIKQAFEKTGIYPFNRKLAEVYMRSEGDTSETNADCCHRKKKTSLKRFSTFHARGATRSSNLRRATVRMCLSYPCPICGKLFQWKRNLSRHTRVHRERAAGATHRCRECDKTFSSRDCYNNHMRLSKRHATDSTYVHECNYCGKKFPTKWCMVDHIDWDHLKRVKYQCSVCFKPFKTAKIMVAHMNNIHEGKRQEPEGEHLCDICGKSYKTVKRLKAHAWAMHTQRSNAKSYKCKLCAATFTWQTSIYKHMKMMHDTKRPKAHRAPSTAVVKKQESFPDLQYYNLALQPLPPNIV